MYNNAYYINKVTDLARHIEILLLNNDCVIVPDFGGFMAHHAHSVYLDDEEIFLPPSRTIGFNPQLVINDSLLAQSYVETYDVSYPEALRLIEQDVNELRQHIANEGSCELDGIGILQLNEEGNYDFTPSQSGILTPSLYALNSFEMSPLAQTANTTQESVMTESPLVCASSETILDSLVDNNNEEEECSSNVISIRVATLKHAMAAAAVLLFFILFSTPLGDHQQLSPRLCSIDSGLLMRLIPGMEVEGSVNAFLITEKEMDAEDMAVSINEDEGENQMVEDANNELEKTVELEKTTQEDCYVIVLASCVTKVSAESYVLNLKKQGIADARILDKTTRRVICGSFATETAAQTALQDIRNTSGIADAWIMNIK